MGYYANGSGWIVFKDTLSPDLFTKVNDTLAEGFERDGIRDPEQKGFASHQTYFDIWDDEKYYGDTVEATLNKVSVIADIKEGHITYHGEDDCIWRFVWKDGKWVEENGTVVFFDPEKVKSRKDHAFYSILGCLDDNLPDCDDEYSEECRRVYEDALEEYREAEQIEKGGTE